MDQIKIEALDLFINSLLRGIYQSDMSDEDCELVIEQAFDELAEMLDEEYIDIFFERIEVAQQELEEALDAQEKVELIMEELGWLSKN